MVIVTLTGCNNGRAYDRYRALDIEGWDRSDTVDFNTCRLTPGAIRHVRGLQGHQQLSFPGFGHQHQLDRLSVGKELPQNCQMQRLRQQRTHERTWRNKFRRLPLSHRTDNRRKGRLGSLHRQPCHEHGPDTGTDHHRTSAYAIRRYCTLTKELQDYAIRQFCLSLAQSFYILTKQ